jgi:arginase family enzyme
MPDTGTPCPGGLTYKDLISKLIYLFQNYEVLGVDLVEYSPITTNTHATSFLVAQIIQNICSLHLIKKGY